MRIGQSYFAQTPHGKRLSQKIQRDVRHEPHGSSRQNVYHPSANGAGHYAAAYGAAAAAAQHAAGYHAASSHYAPSQARNFTIPPHGGYTAALASGSSSPTHGFAPLPMQNGGFMPTLFGPPGGVLATGGGGNAFEPYGASAFAAAAPYM